MSRVITSLLRLKDGCLDGLSARFARWTKPFRTSLPLATLIDLGKSRSQLIAENAPYANNSSFSGGRETGRYSPSR